MVDSQYQTTQQQVIIDLKTSNVDNFRCFNEKLEGLLLETQNGGFMVKPGKKRTYQCTPIESSKDCHNEIYENVSRCKVVHLQIDNIVALSNIK